MNHPDTNPLNAVERAAKSARRARRTALLLAVGLVLLTAILDRSAHAEALDPRAVCKTQIRYLDAVQHQATVLKLDTLQAYVEALWRDSGLPVQMATVLERTAAVYFARRNQPGGYPRLRREFYVECRAYFAVDVGEVSTGHRL